MGPPAAGAQPCASCALDLTKTQVVEGTITSVDIGYGVQYPSIVIGKTVIRLAPVWYLLENDFEIAPGDAVRVTAAPSTGAAGEFLHALEIVKTASGAKIVLRDSSGLPLWLGAARRGGNPQAPRSGGGCVDPSSARTAQGTVEEVTLGVGIQHPRLLFRTAERLLVIQLGPARLLLDSGFEIRAGMTLTVQYAASACNEEYVALKLTNAAGQTVVLRNANGFPA